MFAIVPFIITVLLNSCLLICPVPPSALLHRLSYLQKCSKPVSSVVRQEVSQSKMVCVGHVRKLRPGIGRGCNEDDQ